MQNPNKTCEHKEDLNGNCYFCGKDMLQTHKEKLRERIKELLRLERPFFYHKAPEKEDLELIAEELDELFASHLKEAVMEILPEEKEMTLETINNGYAYRKKVVENLEKWLGR